MKMHFIIPFILLVIQSCTNAQTKNYKLEPRVFSKQIEETNSAVIIDVRTPEEYSQGHLLNAKNIDWNSNEFEKQMALVDTSQTIFIYCLSGGRSASAVSKIRSMGFSNIYELDGGILKWRKEGFPEETTAQHKNNGMTKQQFEMLITSDK
jgi:thioredoxin 1